MKTLSVASASLLASSIPLLASALYIGPYEIRLRRPPHAISVDNGGCFPKVDQTACSWKGHCAGAVCKDGNDCSDDLICISGICSRLAMSDNPNGGNNDPQTEDPENEIPEIDPEPETGNPETDPETEDPKNNPETEDPETDDPETEDPKTDPTTDNPETEDPKNDPETDHETDNPEIDNPETEDPKTDPETDNPETDDPETDDPETEDPKTDPTTDNPETEDPKNNPETEDPKTDPTTDNPETEDPKNDPETDPETDNPEIDNPETEDPKIDPETDNPETDDPETDNPEITDPNLTARIISSPGGFARLVPDNLRKFYEKAKNSGTCSGEDLLVGGFHSQIDGPPEFGYCQKHMAGKGFYIKGPGTELTNMDIDCHGSQTDGDGRCAGSSDTKPQTSFKTSVQGFGISDLNTYIHPYVVLGNEGNYSPTFEPETAGVQPLSVVAVVCGEKLVYGVWGDTNGDNGSPLVGEASLSLATECFGDSMNAKQGHGENDVLYIAFSGPDAVPGDGVNWDAKSPAEFHASIAAAGDKLVASL